MEKNSFDLKKCLTCFDGVYKTRYGRGHGIPTLEKRFASARVQKAISWQDIENLFDENCFSSKFFMDLPGRNEKEPELARLNELLFADFNPENERQLIEEFLKVFKNITLVSTILRFTFPERYGIFSTPVLEITEAHGGHTVDKYLDYLKRIRAKQKEFGFDRASDVDHAYWTLASKSKLQCQEKNCENYFYYKNDAGPLVQEAEEAYFREDYKSAERFFLKAKDINPQEKSIYRGLMDIYRLNGNKRALTETSLEFLDLAENQNDHLLVVEVSRLILQEKRIYEVLESQIGAFDARNNTDELCKALEELKQYYKNDGMVKEAIKTCDRLNNIYGDPSYQAEEIKKLNKLMEIPVAETSLKVCLQCQKIAAKSDCNYTLLEEGKENDCGLCAKNFGRCMELEGKTIGVVGGRGEMEGKYVDAIKKFGAKDVLFNDAVHHPNKIPGVVSGANGIILITGAALHRGTIIAEKEIERMGKPFARVHEIGVSRVLNAIRNELVPRLS